MMNKEEQKSAKEEPCVRIFIHGVSEPVEYDPDCSTEIVKEELAKVYGKGILKRKINGRGVTATILSNGDYEYHATPENPKQGKLSHSLISSIASTDTFL